MLLHETISLLGALTAVVALVAILAIASPKSPTTSYFSPAPEWNYSSTTYRMSEDSSLDEESSKPLTPPFSVVYPHEDVGDEYEVQDKNGMWVASFEEEPHANMFVSMMNGATHKIEVKNLYLKTGDIKDINTLLINRNDLSKIVSTTKAEIHEL